jgi:hypothetical protein
MHHNSLETISFDLPDEVPWQRLWQQLTDFAALVVLDHVAGVGPYRPDTRRSRPQSSSASRLTAGAADFFILSQSRASPNHLTLRVRR